MGKGSTRRPQNIDDRKLAKNWAQTFGAKKGRCVVCGDDSMPIVGMVCDDCTAELPMMHGDN